MVDFTLLDPEFNEKITELTSVMTGLGYTLQPQSGFRSLKNQGKLWRQGRSSTLVKGQIQALTRSGFKTLADAIQSAGAQMSTKICTHAIPGYSWHNWGRALDVFVNNDASGSYELYGTLANEATKLGLTSGFNFTTFKDPGHLQLNEHEVPELYTMKYVNDHFSQ